MRTEIPSGKQPCECAKPAHAARLVVITGGPGAGKTAVLELLRVMLCRHVAVLPEAASILFVGGFPRGESIHARKAVQRSIVRVQRELERLALEEGNHGVVLCDRGTLDGLAYWPDDERSFFADTVGSREEELARYAAVVHLAVPLAGEGYNQHNPVRTETADEAARIDERIAAAWRDHPRRHYISSHPAFVDKARAAVEVVRAELPECCRS